VAAVVRSDFSRYSAIRPVRSSKVIVGVQLYCPICTQGVSSPDTEAAVDNALVDGNVVVGLPKVVDSVLTKDKELAPEDLEVELGKESDSSWPGRTSTFWLCGTVATTSPCEGLAGTFKAVSSSRASSELGKTVVAAEGTSDSSSASPTGTSTGHRLHTERGGSQ
jgi:hypothetical protein